MTMFRPGRRFLQDAEGKLMTIESRQAQVTRPAPSKVTSIVEHVRPDDSDEHIDSKKLKLTELDNLPSGAPMSADANLSGRVFA